MLKQIKKHRIRNILIFISCFLFASCNTGPKKEVYKHLDEDYEISEEQQVKKFKHHVDWGYKGETGPDSWASLHHEFHRCDDGTEQSPVDLVSHGMYTEHKLNFNYSSTQEIVFNHAHTLQFNYDIGSNVHFDGITYELLQFHFHTPSEHHIDGNVYPMEIHFVHRSEDGKFLVVGIMVEQGERNEFISTIDHDLPVREEEDRYHKDIDISHLFPEKDHFFSYQGSFTTPPCTEEVRWIIFKHPISASKKQIEAFRSIIGNNARPIRPINHRVIIEFAKQ